MDVCRGARRHNPYQEASRARGGNASHGYRETSTNHRRRKTHDSANNALHADAPRNPQHLARSNNHRKGDEAR